MLEDSPYPLALFLQLVKGHKHMRWGNYSESSVGPGFLEVLSSIPSPFNSFEAIYHLPQAPTCDAAWGPQL